MVSSKQKNTKKIVIFIMVSSKQKNIKKIVIFIMVSSKHKNTKKIVIFTICQRYFCGGFISQKGTKNTYDNRFKESRDWMK